LHCLCLGKQLNKMSASFVAPSGEILVGLPTRGALSNILNSS
jgi:hypothetical protein